MAGGRFKKTLTEPVTKDELQMDLPPGWSAARLGTLAELINGDRGKNYPSKKHRVSRGVPFVNAGHLEDGAIIHSDMHYITEEHFDRLSSGKLLEGDIIDHFFYSIRLRAAE